MRLIDADALIEQQFKNDISYNAFCSLVKRQKTISQPNWIPVTEALPDTPIKHPSRYGVDEYCESKPLIFQLANKEDDDIFYTGMLSGCYCDDLNGYTYFATADACSFEIEKVAAWMPLPEPYEGSK